jgi:hypothetical protein
MDEKVQDGPASSEYDCNDSGNEERSHKKREKNIKR